MPSYKLTCINRDGQIKELSQEAESVERLRALLEREGLELLTCTEEKRRLKRRNKSYKLKISELATMLFKLGIQLRAGVPLLDALQMRNEDDGVEQKDRHVRRRLAEVVESGKTLSAGMEEFPRVFPKYVSNIVKVSERSGSLPDNLIQLRDYLEWMDKNWKAFKQAMIYPSCVMAALVIFIIVALKFVFPNIIEILYELEVPLPWITKVLIQASEFVEHYWYTILATVFFGPIFFRILCAKSKTAAYARDYCLLRLPFLGEVILNLALNRFLKSLILMMQAGIVITEALAHSRDVVGNRKLEAHLLRVETAVANGEPMSELMQQEKIFPSLVVTMIGVGERSGSMDESLEAVVTYYDDLVPRKIKAFFAILEPGLIVVTILIAGAVAAAVFMPLISMLQPGGY